MSSGLPIPELKKRIFLTVGLPGSGKSSYLHDRKIQPLSSDQLRQLLTENETEQRYQTEIFAALQMLLRTRLRIGMHASYVDATNLAREWRRPFLDIAREFDCDIEALYFDVPLEICLRRNAGRGRQVPEEAIRILAEKLEPPTLEEGFQCITVIDEHALTLKEIRSPLRKA